jgi:hypothetical protein
MAAPVYAATSPTVETEEADVYEDEATLRGYLDSYGSFSRSDIREYGFIYKDGSGTLSESNGVMVRVGSSISSGNSFEYLLTDFDYDRTYRYRAYVRYYDNGSSKYAYGSTMSFRADDDYYSGDNYSERATVVTFEAAFNQGATTATLYGEISSRGGSSINEYGFYWGTNSNVTNRKRVGTDNISIGQDFETTISGLNRYTKYYYRAYAINDEGISYGTLRNFTIDEYDGGNKAVVTTQEPQISGSQVTFRGYVNDRGSSSIDGYGFYWGTSSNPTSRQIVGSYIDDNETFTYTLSDLKIGTTYYVKAYAKNEAGEAEGKILSFRAAGNTSITLTTQTNNLTGGGAILMGSIDNNSADSTGIEAYGFYWGPLNGAETEIRLGNTITPGTVFSYFLTGLDSGKTYVARAYARSASNTYLGNQVTINPLDTGIYQPETSGGAPGITISSPTANTAVSKGSAVLINAVAVPGGSNPIAAMGLYINGTQVARPTGAVLGYSLDTASLPLGTNIIRITAWDGSKSAEQSVSINVTGGSALPDTPANGAAPVITLQNPANFEIVKRGTIVQIKASAAFGSNSVSNAMGLYLYDKQLLRVEGNGFTYFWDTSAVNPGKYEIKVTGWDGQRQGDKLITVTVQ